MCENKDFIKYNNRVVTVTVIYDKAFLAHEKLVVAVCSIICVMTGHSAL